MTDNEVAELVAEFDERLRSDVAAVRARLVAIQKGKDAGEDRIPRQLVLQEMLHSLQKVVEKRTSMPERRQFNPNVAVEGYGELAERFNAVENKLHKEHAPAFP